MSGVYEVPDRRTTDAQRWESVNQRITDLERGQAVINEGLLRSERLVEENTTLTREGLAALQSKLDAQAASTQPVTDALKTMEAGIKTLGAIGRYGKRAVVAGLYIVGAWLFLRHLISGDGLEAAAAAFWKSIGPR